MKIEPNNIYCGDCYELIKQMPDKSVDLIITDPPYEMTTGGCGKKEMSIRFRKRYKELQDKNLDVGMDLSFLKELERVCKYIYIYIYGAIKCYYSNLSLITHKEMMSTLI